MTSLSHSEDRRFESGQAHYWLGDIDKAKKVVIFRSIYINLNILSIQVWIKMIIQSNNKTEWTETVINTLEVLKSKKDSFLIRPVLPLLDRIINIGSDRLQFYSLSKKEIEKESKEIKIPEQMNLLVSSFFVSCEKTELLTISSISFSANLIDRIGNTTMMGVISAARIIGTDVNNNDIDIEGMIFNPGWSIPVNINGVNGKDVLITLGKFNFIIFYDANNEVVVLLELV